MREYRAFVAVCCTLLHALQRVAVCCSVLQRVAAGCSVLMQKIGEMMGSCMIEYRVRVSVCCSVLQCVVVCCSVLKYVARA